jgi:ubiquinone/menaquinone biosynthesis C-methylase UbiE
MNLRKLALTGAAVAIGGAAVFAATPLGRDLLFHVLPISWTGEAARLSTALNIGSGSVVADIGAGSGALIVELSRVVGPAGRAYASERTPEQRQRIVERAAAGGVAVTAIAAGDRSTNLPDGCCDGITLRTVMHHIDDHAAFARDLRRSLRPGGRVGIIDFAPGAMPHLGGDHGVGPADVTSAFQAAGFIEQSRDEQWGGRTYLMVFRAP